MRSVKQVGGLLFIGFIFVVLGIFQLADSSVKCGGKTQNENQVCVSNGESRSLAEQRDENRSQAWIILGVGSALVLAGGFGVLKNRSRNGQAVVAPVQSQPWSQPFPPQFPAQQYQQPRQYPQAQQFPPHQPYTPQQYSQSFGPQGQQPPQWR